MKRHWHSYPVEDSLTHLQANAARGLEHAEARRRLSLHGPNEIARARRGGGWTLLLAQFKDFMILVLIAAAGVAAVIGEHVDAWTILVIVLLNAAIGFAQSWRADRSLEALGRLAQPNATVRRAGAEHSVPARDLVPGDIVLVEAGNQIPADLRLLESEQFQSDESALTGESQPVAKVSHVLEGTPVLAERRNMAYKGTLAVRGRALGLAVETGMATELGRVASLLAAQEDVGTPLQARLGRFGRQLSMAIVAIAVLVYLLGVWRGEAPLPMLLTALSLAVAAIPESLPTVVTVALALGAARMARQQALVRHLPAVETLGSVTYICSDKTGTLTENRMHVASVYCGGAVAPAPGREAAGLALAQAMLLNNDARHGGPEDALSGDPTEIALLESARSAAGDEAAVRAASPRLAERPFDSERKRMLTIHREQGGVRALLKGAPEVVLPLCSRALDMRFERSALEAQAERMAADGCRVLAFAQRRLPRMPEALDAVEQDLEFIGLVGMIDPPRESARAAVAAARGAGIETMMITGDHPATAAAIARAVGIELAGGVLTGTELERMSDETLGQQVNKVRVYARASPEQKIRIVEALRRRGETVAVTGDGVNDAPALRRADIGVAMGGKGTDVAREAADLVLLDDNYGTIVAAVGEGRRIYENIRKFVKYAVTTNSAEVLVLLLAPLLGLPLPLLATQILWINLVSDGLPGLALAVDPADADGMRRRPRPRDENLFARGLGAHVVWMGLLIAGLALGLHAWAVTTGVAHGQTMVFTVIPLAQMAQVLSIRCGQQPLLRRGGTHNGWLYGAVAVTVLAQMLAIYLPWFNAVFSTQPLSLPELTLCFAMVGIVLLASELEKFAVRRGWLYSARNRG